MLASDNKLSRHGTLVLTVATGIYIIAHFMQTGAANTIRAWEFCASGQVMQGHFPVSDMPRLAAVVRQGHENSLARYRVAGLVDEHRRYLLSGEVSCEVSLTCQRCMQEVIYCLESDFLLALLSTEHQEKDLPAQFDPLVLANHDELKLISVIEDELLLELPISPMHDPDSECARKHLSSGGSPQPGAEDDRRISATAASPFAGLAGLRDKLKSG